MVVKGRDGNKVGGVDTVTSSGNGFFHYGGGLPAIASLRRKRAGIVGNVVGSPDARSRGPDNGVRREWFGWDGFRRDSSDGRRTRLLRSWNSFCWCG